MRRDSFGFFWNDTPVEKVRGARGPAAPRPIPEIPDNGWKPPKDFPRLEKAKLIAIDTETKDLELTTKGPGVRRGAEIVGMSVATEDHKAWYFPMRHTLGENLPVENVLAWARDNLTRPKQPKVGTNLLYDLDFLAEAGVDVAGPFYDVQVAEALLDENANGYSLEDISQRRLGKGKTTDALAEWALAAYGNKNFRAEIWRSPSNLVGPYAESDAINPIQILEKQLPLLQNEDLMRVWEIECRQIEPLLAMRRRGVRVNLKRAEQVEARLEKSIATDLAKLRDMVGFDVNVNAAASLVKMFDKLGIKYPRTAASARFPEGQPSFVKEFLEHHEHPGPQLITSIRRWTKFRDTFIRGYIYGLHVNGRIHCLFNQTVTDDYGAVSGRYSSSLPNLQNIPARDLIWGPLIRSIFVPEPGHRWAKLDWSQIEYRILVHLAFMRLKGEFGSQEAHDRYAKDPKTDYHEFVAEITGVRRKIAKNINFGLVYGMGPPELARQLGMSLRDADPIFGQYHTALPFVKEIREQSMKAASNTGYITTVLGRRRRFDLWQPRGGNLDEKALRMKAAIAKWGPRLRRAYTHKSLNGEIQGSAADLMKKAIADYWDSDMRRVLGAPLLTVHDELDFDEPPTKEARQAVDEVKLMMENTMQLSVPILADLSRAADWGKTKA